MNKPDTRSLLPHLPVLGREEEAALLKQAKSGSQEARDKLVLHNIPFLLHRIRNIRTRFDRDDLVHIGVLGLLQAIDRWDVSRKTKFITYAAHWVHQALNNLDKLQLVRVPSSTRYTRKRKHQSLLRDGEVMEIALVLDLVEHESLIGQDDHDIPDGVARKEELDLLHRAISELPDKLRCVAVRKLEGQTLKEIGDSLEPVITKEAVRQRWTRALRHITNKLDRSGCSRMRRLKICGSSTRKAKPCIVPIRPPLETVKHLITEFEKLQSKHASLGATDTEPDAKFQGALWRAVNGQSPAVPTGARSWSLFRGKGVRDAARELTAACDNIVDTIRMLSVDQLEEVRRYLGDYCWRITA